MCSVLCLVNETVIARFIQQTDCAVSIPAIPEPETVEAITTELNGKCYVSFQLKCERNCQLYSKIHPNYLHLHDVYILPLWSTTQREDSYM